MKDVPTVAAYMATDLLTFAPNDEINVAMRKLLERRYSGAPVVDASGRLVGVLSKKDCLRSAFAATYHRDWGGTVAESMSTELQTLDADTSVLDAVQLMLESPYRRFPVLRDGVLVGQISRYDLLRALVDDWNDVPPPTTASNDS